MFLGAGSLISTSLGCGGSENARVSGQAAYSDGKPFVGGRVIARSNATGVSATGITDEDGNFELTTASNDDGVPPGDYNVSVVEQSGELDVRRKPTIAAKYADPARSGIAFTIQPGQDQEIELKLDPP
jgi:hypothetical protein